jgi:uncharacterized RDD family membrane protein YckC
MCHRRFCGLLRRIGIIIYDAFLLIALLLFAAVPPVVLHGGAIEDSPLFTVYLMFVAFLFFGGFWAYGGQTLGMKAWRVRLRQVDGSAVTWRDAAIRFAAAITSWIPLGAGYLWCLIDRDGLAWHDRLSGTRLWHVHKSG